MSLNNVGRHRTKARRTIAHYSKYRQQIKIKITLHFRIVETSNLLT